MKQFEIELNSNLYSGWYEVHDKGLFLHNVTKRLADEKDHEVNRLTELKAVEEALEDSNASYEINEERERIFFVVNGRMPEREYDC
jgi:hypothetical protein